MSTDNFMLADCRAIFVSFCLFPLAGFGPGYALGSLLDIMRFRTRTLAGRVTLSVALSISLAPTLTYFLGRYVSLDAVCLLFAASCLYAASTEIRRHPGRTRFRFSRFPKSYLPLLGLVCLWITLAVLSLADLQIGRRLYFSIIGFDYFVRTAFTTTISTFGIPPRNPFYFPGHPVILRYHYFWLAQAALVHHLASPLVDARQAFIGATIWAGIGLICVLALYLRFFSPHAASSISRRTFIGVCLLGVTGLDILPTLLLLWLARAGLIHGISPSVEWWNNQIDGWLYTMLWEPHYLAGLIACLTGFLIIWTTPRNANRKQCVVAAITAGLAFATGVGAALYVAMVFAVFLLCWTVIGVGKRWYREVSLLTGAGCVAAVLSAPFLLSLLEPASGGTFLQLTVRSFSLGEICLKALGITHPWQLALGDVVFLPLNYFLELGFFFAIARIAWARFRAQCRRCTRQELAAFTMICVSAGVCTFLKSGVIENNDLGWRGFLVAQFALLLLATDLLATNSGSTGPPLTSLGKNLLAVLLLIGAAGAIYDLGILRFFPVLSDAGVVPKIAWLANDEHLGTRTFANRQAYEWLRANTSPRSIIQQNPNPVLQDTFYGLYANRQTIAESSNCGTVFGGNLRECVPVVQRLSGLFSAGVSSMPETFAAACHNFPIDVLVAKDTDAAWANRNSWVWTRRPSFANQYVRLFHCVPQPHNLVLTYRGKNRD